MIIAEVCLRLATCAVLLYWMRGGGGGGWGPVCIWCDHHLPHSHLPAVSSSTSMRTTSMQMSFPEMVSDSLCRNSLVMHTDCCCSCPGGWSQTILDVKMLDVEALGWCVYMWSAVVRPVGYTAKFSETPLEMAYGREMNIQFTGNRSGGHSCSQHANWTLSLKTRDICGIVLCDKI